MCSTEWVLLGCDKNLTSAEVPYKMFCGHLGGGPEIVAAHGDLGTINPKTSSIKEKTWKSFETKCWGPGPVRSNQRPKKRVGQYVVAMICGPSATGGVFDP